MIIVEKKSNSDIKIEGHVMDNPENGKTDPLPFINPLIPGDVVDHDRVYQIFRGTPEGGMRRSHKTNTLVLVSDHTKAIYDDRWIGDTFHFTGMGRLGDQSLNFQQNKTLKESQVNGINSHLFEVFIPNNYVYIGEVYLAEEPYTETQPDKHRCPRQVYVFPLKLKSPQDKPVIEEEIIQKKEEYQQKKAIKLSNSDLEEKARHSRKIVGIREVKATRYERNPYVGEHAKRRAEGLCQLCGKPAPFVDKNGSPYLETHHIQWLSRGGEDSIENTVALCPNCHKRMHILDLDTDKAILASKIGN